MTECDNQSVTKVSKGTRGPDLLRVRVLSVQEIDALTVSMAVRDARDVVTLTLEA